MFRANSKESLFQITNISQIMAALHFNYIYMTGRNLLISQYTETALGGGNEKSYTCLVSAWYKLLKVQSFCFLKK